MKLETQMSDNIVEKYERVQNKSGDKLLWGIEISQGNRRTICSSKLTQQALLQKNHNHLKIDQGQSWIQEKLET